MSKRYLEFIEFNRTFVRYALYLRETIGGLLLLIVLGGWVIAKVEGIKLGDALYFAFITGLSIGYGDIVPKTGLGRIVSVAIGLVGMIFVGLSVAIAARALADTTKRELKTDK